MRIKSSIYNLTGMTGFLGTLFYGHRTTGWILKDFEQFLKGISFAMQIFQPCSILRLFFHLLPRRPRRYITSQSKKYLVLKFHFFHVCFIAVFIYSFPISFAVLPRGRDTSFSTPIFKTLFQFSFCLCALHLFCSTAQTKRYLVLNFQPQRKTNLKSKLKSCCAKHGNGYFRSWIHLRFN